MIKVFSLSAFCFYAFFSIGGLMILSGCEKEASLPSHQLRTTSPQHLDIGLATLLKNAELTVQVTPRSPGYYATAKGSGVIPAGEYAGQHFKITFSGHYSDLGPETLTTGDALVKIRGERYESINDPALESFCCGGGGIELIDGEYVFYLYGQVLHSTAAEPHNHLFAAAATTAGTFNMNIADQSGTVVIPIDPPHDPGIGLLEDLEAQQVQVSPE